MNLFARLLLSACVALAATACGTSGKGDARLADSTGVLTVETVVRDPASYVGKKVTVEGICSHYGKYEGRRAFVEGTTDSVFIRCDATAAMGGRFDRRSLGKRVRMVGLLQEQKIDERYVMEQEKGFRERMKLYRSTSARRGDTMRINEGEAALVDNPYQLTGSRNPDSVFAETIAEYRRRIAQSLATDGKGYFPVYYIDVTAYEIVDD